MAMTSIPSFPEFDIRGSIQPGRAACQLLSSSLGSRIHKPGAERDSESRQLPGNLHHVEFGLEMELALNLVWVLLAVTVVRLWMRYAPRQGAGIGTQIAALAMLLVILFPVISVTDDLQAAQNPCEVETCMRRAHASTAPHSVLSGAALPPAVFADLPYGDLGVTALQHPAVLRVDNPSHAVVRNRPPPVA